MARGMCGWGGGMHGILEAGNDVFVNFENDQNYLHKKTIWLQRKDVASSCLF